MMFRIELWKEDGLLETVEYEQIEDIHDYLSVLEQVDDMLLRHHAWDHEVVNPKGLYRLLDHAYSEDVRWEGQYTCFYGKDGNEVHVTPIGGLDDDDCCDGEDW